MKALVLDKSQEELWFDFVSKHPLGNIHQIPAWGLFQEKVPSRGKYWIIGLFNDADELIGGTLLVRYQLPKGLSWLYSPRGPLINYEKPVEEMEALTLKIRQIASKEKSVFWRIDPGIELNEESEQKIYKGGIMKKFKTVKYGFQPEHSLILDLEPTEAEILKQMKPKGRYNIKVAHKKGIEVRKINHKNAHELEKGIDDFYAIFSETTSRDHFTGHPKEYYKNFLTKLAESPASPKNNQPAAALYLAYLKDTPLAGLLATYHADTATYYFGASSNQHRNLMAPYALHWKAIQDAKAQGFKKYDFFGVAPPNNSKHSWAGVTQFKTRFGGTRTQYPKAMELPLKKMLYSLYSFKKKW